jgi:hypothetical protein
VRTDYSDQETWVAVLGSVLQETEEGFRADLEVVEDRGFDGFGVAQVRAVITEDYEYSFILAADKITMTATDHPLLVIDLFDESGRSFRAVPLAIQAIENNLSIANMSFFEFADHVDPDGVFRDFPPDP